MKIKVFNDKTQLVLQKNNDQLKQFYSKCQKDKLIGIDTEFYRVDSYYPKLCLIQMSNTNESILLDPIDGFFDRHILKKILFNTKIKKIFYAARQDIEIFYNIFKKVPRPIIDIQICLIALGYTPSTSYATACRDFLNITIDKKNQFIDWRIRPLKKDEITYAINDVKYLIPLFRLICKKLNNNDSNMLNSYYKKIIREEIYIGREKKAWEKIRFKPKNKVELEKLKRFSKIREKLAMKKDIPVKRIASDNEIRVISKLTCSKEQKRIIFGKLNIKI